MDTKQLLEAKKELENKIFSAINQEINSFHDQTGLLINEIEVTFREIRNSEGEIGNVHLLKVTCKISLE